MDNDEDREISEINREIKEDQYEKLEDLIKSCLPDDFDIDLAVWKVGLFKQNSSTLFYDGDPVLTVFPEEFDQSETEDEVVLTVTRRYIKHE